MDSSSQKKPFNRGRSPFHYIQIDLSTAIVLTFVERGLFSLLQQASDVACHHLQVVVGWPY